MRIISAEQLFSSDYNRPMSKTEKIIQEEVKKEVFRLGLAKIVDESILESWKEWGFSFTEMAYNNPDVALEYLGWAENPDLSQREDPYVNALRGLPENKISAIKELLLTYIQL